MLGIDPFHKGVGLKYIGVYIPGEKREAILSHIFLDINVITLM
jgi:hypothetical protein